MLKRVLLSVLILPLLLTLLPARIDGVAGLSTVSAADQPDQDVSVCSQATTPETARCHAHLRTDAKARNARPQRSAPGRSKPPQATPHLLGNMGAYDPAYLQSAYNLTTLARTGGMGQLAAIVDAYDAPTAESDLAVYRSYFGLPPCTSATGCFQKVNQDGVAGPYPAPHGGWAQEIALDLQMVSAICPNCRLLLVEANSASLSDLGEAVNTAARLGAAVISNSYGAVEFSSAPAYAAAYYNHPGIAITASAGDRGYGVEFPAASNTVIAVGGTTLNQATGDGSRAATETAWSGTGSGCSAYISKPVWQTDLGCGRRTVADVAAVADPSTGVWVYDGYGYNGRQGWLILGGTSVAAPIVAAAYALAGKSAQKPVDVSFPYTQPASSLNDITAGSNGSCGGSYLCTAVVGYDGPTGLGTLNGVGGFGIAAPPVALRINVAGPAYTDSGGRSWSADTGFSGGSLWSSSEGVAGTADPLLYQTQRYGAFDYQVPLANGSYAVTLKFAETYWAQAGQRVFNVAIEGQQVLSDFDILAQAARATAVDRTFPVTVVDGLLSIGFTSVVDYAVVSAIEAVPLRPGPSTRVNAGGDAYADSSGQQWTADTGFAGGWVWTAPDNVANTPDPELYRTQRYGDFRYQFAMDNGDYMVTLKFAEIYWQQAGQRVFDVAIQGQPVLTGFDILAQTAPRTALDRTFQAAVNSGILTVDFTSRVDYAVVGAIQVVPAE